MKGAKKCSWLQSALKHNSTKFIGHELPRLLASEATWPFTVTPHSAVCFASLPVSRSFKTLRLDLYTANFTHTVREPYFSQCQNPTLQSEGTQLWWPPGWSHGPTSSSLASVALLRYKSLSILNPSMKLAIAGEQLHVWRHGDRAIILPLYHTGHLSTPFGFSWVCQNLSLSLMCNDSHCNSSIASCSAHQRLAEQPNSFSPGFGEWEVLLQEQPVVVQAAAQAAAGALARLLYRPGALRCLSSCPPVAHLAPSAQLNPQAWFWHSAFLVSNGKMVGRYIF